MTKRKKALCCSSVWTAWRQPQRRAWRSNWTLRELLLGLHFHLLWSELQSIFRVCFTPHSEYKELFVCRRISGFTMLCVQMAQHVREISGRVSVWIYWDALWSHFGLQTSAFCHFSPFPDNNSVSRDKYMHKTACMTHVALCSHNIRQIMQTSFGEITNI